MKFSQTKILDGCLFPFPGNLPNSGIQPVSPVLVGTFFTLSHQGSLTWSPVRNPRFQFSSVQFSRLVVSNSVTPSQPQHTRPPCPSLNHRVHSNPCPSSRWCHPAITSSVVPFSSCPQSFPASGSFPMSQLFASVGQSIGVSASTSVLPMNTQD